MKVPLKRRLQAYWRMETANILIVPATFLVIVLSLGGNVGGALAAALAACCAFLVVGALYWRAVSEHVEGRPRALRKWLPRLARAEWPCLALTILACILCVVDFPSWHGTWPIQRIVGIAVTVIAVLEYLNYYRIQLQHFDSVSDFRRLLEGKGFREAHLRRDIRRWRHARHQSRAGDGREPS